MRQQGLADDIRRHDSIIPTGDRGSGSDGISMMFPQAVSGTDPSMSAVSSKNLAHWTEVDESTERTAHPSDQIHAGLQDAIDVRRKIRQFHS